MRITLLISVLFTLSAATGTSARLAKRHTKFAKRAVHCGTAADATLSDCQALTSDQAIWDANFNTGNTCHFSNPTAYPSIINAQALNIACHNDCCVYFYTPSAFTSVAGGPSFDSKTLQDEAAGLLGCGDVEKDKVNGMQKFTDGHAICISNGSGCSDCFDDSDFNAPA